MSKPSISVALLGAPGQVQAGRDLGHGVEGRFGVEIKGLHTSVWRYICGYTARIERLSNRDQPWSGDHLMPRPVDHVLIAHT